MIKLGKRINILLLLILCSFLFASCQKDEVYTPVKKTGEEAPHVELPLPESKQEDKEEPEEEPKEKEKKEKKNHDFSTLQVFKAAQEEIIVRQGPSIDAEIIKYFAEGEELIVVDKVKGQDGQQWFVVRLFDYDLTYGFTVISNLSYVKEIQVETEKATEGEPQSNEE